MESVDCKERCNLLRTYFQKVNPNSIPCTYKSNFEDSAIQSLLATEIENYLSPPPPNNCLNKDFGPWNNCSSLSSSKSSIKSTVESTKKLCRPLQRRLSTYRSASECNNLEPRVIKFPYQAKQDKITLKSLRPEDASKNVSPSIIPYKFKYDEDYKQYIETYRKTYTLCKIQEANQGRQVAARQSLRAYDFRNGLKNPHLSVAPLLGPVTSIPRALAVKTVTLQMPPEELVNWCTSKPDGKRITKSSKSAY